MPELGRQPAYELDGGRSRPARGVPVPLGSRAFPIFAVLVRSAGELVTKRELIAHVWPDAIVEENKLQVHISAIRKALGTDRGLVKTSSGRGYRLAGDWTIRKESSPVDPVAPGPRRMPVHPFLTNVPAAGSELIGRNAATQHLREISRDFRSERRVRRKLQH
jgi:non-specific serine/threonine protein kinase